jgi:hypothetical protein
MTTVTSADRGAARRRARSRRHPQRLDRRLRWEPVS